MDEFARIMSMEGVCPLNQPSEISGRRAKEPRPVARPRIVAMPALGPGGHASVTGPGARTALILRLSALSSISAKGGVAGQSAFAKMARRSRCLLRQGRHRCWAPQIATRCAL
jgi:hypothetical protein